MDLNSALLEAQEHEFLYFRVAFFINGARAATKTGLGYKTLMNILEKEKAKPFDQMRLDLYKNKQENAPFFSQTLTEREVLSGGAKTQDGGLSSYSPVKAAPPLDFKGFSSAQTAQFMELRHSINILEGEKAYYIKKYLKTKKKLKKAKRENKGLGDVSIKASDLAAELAKTKDELLTKSNKIEALASFLYDRFANDPRIIDKIFNGVGSLLGIKAAPSQQIQQEPKAIEESERNEERNELNEKEIEINNMLTKLEGAGVEEIRELSSYIKNK